MKIWLALTCSLVVPLLGGCYGLYGNDEMARYVQRSDTMTLSTGDAKEVNAVTHMLTPWPPGVTDRRIPADGDRMAGAVQNYKNANKAKQGGTPAGGGAK